MILILEKNPFESKQVVKFIYSEKATKLEKKT